MSETMRCDLCGNRYPFSQIERSGALTVIRFPDIGEQEVDEYLCESCMGKTISVKGE